MTAHAQSFVSRRAVPAFPGATFAVGADGVIRDAWLGPASPIESANGDFLAALDIDDASSDAARVQLLLAMSCGAPAQAWPVFAADAPMVLIRRDGRPLAMLWQPMIVGGHIDAIAAFAVTGEPPLSSLARRLVRLTRTLGADLGKNIACEVDLGDLLVAPEIGRVIGEILVHAVRNAADHGIGTPPERAALGKDPTGTIRVEARDKSGRLVVTVSDDGRGIDLDKVRRTAIERGLLTSETAAEATDFEVLDVLFSPGFSTATAVTAISGRGVGMDVIKCLAEEQGGSVTLFSVRGRGTRLVLDLPFAPP